MSIDNKFDENPDPLDVTLRIGHQKLVDKWESRGINKENIEDLLYGLSAGIFLGAYMVNSGEPDLLISIPGVYRLLFPNSRPREKINSFLKPFYYCGYIMASFIFIGGILGGIGSFFKGNKDFMVHTLYTTMYAYALFSYLAAEYVSLAHSTQQPPTPPQGGSKVENELVEVPVEEDNNVNHYRK